MTDFVYFLGRFHVLALHLPIGMLLLTVVLDFLSGRPRYHHLSQVLPLCWGATALTAALTAVLGLMHFAEGGFAGPAAGAHRNYGISVAAVSLGVWFLAAKLPALYRQVRLYSNLLLLFLITMTGHYGGNLTHGATYLVEYAPPPIRALAGLAPRRAAVSDVSLADPWHDIVKPMLQSRCGSCHNRDKQRGQLDLSSLDMLMLGGESGAVVLAGNAAGSDLYRRVNLPESHENFMPAEGKTPLTEHQVQILRWWIDAGLPADATVAALSVEPDIAALLAEELGLGAPVPMLPVDPYPSVPAAVLDQLVSLGWLVRPLAQESNGLIISINSVGQPATRPMLEALAGAKQSIVELNLASAGLNDELLAAVGEMPALETLNLGNNGISDEGLATVAAYTSLRVLNLYGNPQISDTGLATLAALDNLGALYLWGTATSQAGVASITAALAGLAVHGQSQLVVTESDADQ